jgi:NAD(P)-dependent dehydrogenase (short-subunit alcohol dehydrogenase family)
MKNKSEVVVVTGGSAGVGRAVVRKFAQAGARIGVLARGTERLEETQHEVAELGGQALAISTDVADAGQVESAAQRIEEEFGPIDIWINNAMTSVFSPVKDMTAAEFRRVTDVTYLGYVHGTMSALKRMLPRDRGCIVQVGSALAYRSIPLQAAYCAAKHAIRGFTDSLRSELIHDGSHVQLTAVHLPAINTPQFSWVKSRLPRRAQPVPPIYQPEVAAEAIYHAAHHPRRELLVGFSAVQAIIGNKISPAVLDRYLANAAYDGQQTDEPEDPKRPHNLWEPVPGNFEAHGSFGAESRKWSPQLAVSKHRRSISLAAMALAGAAAAAIFGWKKKWG